MLGAYYCKYVLQSVAIDPNHVDHMQHSVIEGLQVSYLRAQFARPILGDTK